MEMLKKIKKIDSGKLEKYGTDKITKENKADLFSTLKFIVFEVLAFMVMIFCLEIVQVGFISFITVLFGAGMVIATILKMMIELVKASKTALLYVYPILIVANFLLISLISTIG